MKTLSFKVTEDEARLIRSRAAKASLSVSEFLRRQAGSSGASAGHPSKIKCRHTGALIFGPLPQSAPLTTENVREMLTDFP